MSGHTLGPWVVAPRRAGSPDGVVSGASGRPVAITAHQDDDSEFQANLRLIAAAVQFGTFHVQALVRVRVPFVSDSVAAVSSETEGTRDETEEDLRSAAVTELYDRIPTAQSFEILGLGVGLRSLPHLFEPRGLRRVGTPSQRLGTLPVGRPDSLHLLHLLLREAQP